MNSIQDLDELANCAAGEIDSCETVGTETDDEEVSAYVTGAEDEACDGDGCPPMAWYVVVTAGVPEVHCVTDEGHRIWSTPPVRRSLVQWLKRRRLVQLLPQFLQLPPLSQTRW